MKKINGFPDYLITRSGKVFSKKRKCYLSPVLTGEYYYVRLYSDKYPKGKNIVIHKIVIEHFNVSQKKTPYIKHLDGRKLNNEYSNLAYCNFKDLMIVGKKRKKTVCRISILQKIEAYKYYFQFLDESKLKAYINTVGFNAENMIIKKRWGNKNKLSEAEEIFKSHCERVSHKEITINFNCSYYKVRNSIYEVRKKLIDDILLDVKNGLLVYNFINLKNDKPHLHSSAYDPIKYWENYKTKMLTQ